MPNTWGAKRTVGVMLPEDLHEELRAVCKETGMRASHIVEAQLRKVLGAYRRRRKQRQGKAAATKAERRVDIMYTGRT